jgi:hypothetical protein
MRPLLLAFLLTFALMVGSGKAQDNASTAKAPPLASPASPSADKSPQFEKLREEALRFDPTCMAKTPAKQWDGTPTRCLCRAICTRAGLTTLGGEDKLWFTSCADFGFCSDVTPPTASTPSGTQLEFLPPELRELFQRSRKDVIG